MWKLSFLHCSRYSSQRTWWLTHMDSSCPNHWRRRASSSRSCRLERWPPRSCKSRSRHPKVHCAGSYRCILRQIADSHQYFERNEKSKTAHVMESIQSRCRYKRFGKVSQMEDSSRIVWEHLWLPVASSYRLFDPTWTHNTRRFVRIHLWFSSPSTREPSHPSLQVLAQPQAQSPPSPLPATHRRTPHSSSKPPPSPLSCTTPSPPLLLAPLSAPKHAHHCIRCFIHGQSQVNIAPD